jgi:hypothetical protein
MSLLLRSVLLRSVLVISFAGLVLQACGQEESAAPVEAPAVVAPAAADASGSSGGYEPSADERVPGITLDAAALEAQMNAAKAEAEAANKAN